MNNTRLFEMGEEALFKATRYVNYIERENNRNDLLEAIESEKPSDSIFGNVDKAVNMYSKEDTLEGDKEAFNKICVIPLNDC